MSKFSLSASIKIGATHLYGQTGFDDRPLLYFQAFPPQKAARALLALIMARSPFEVAFRVW